MRLNSKVCLLLPAVLAASVLLMACKPKEPAPGQSSQKDEKAVVYVVSYPLRYFSERIAGDHARVEFPVPADVDPAYWKPDAETIVAYQQADLIVLNGAGHAGWVEQASLPETRKVDTSRAFRKSLILLDEAVTHSHGPEGRHEHGETAFTTWLDPKLCVQQADAIREALTRLRPELAQAFQDRFRALEKDLQDLDGKLESLFGLLREKPLVASHPVYQYLTRRYGLNVRSVHWEPDQTPTDRQWKELEELLAGHPARWMLWEAPPREDVAGRLKELGVGVLLYEPCGNVPARGDFFGVMLQNVESLRAALANSN